MNIIVVVLLLVPLAVAQSMPGGFVPVAVDRDDVQLVAVHAMNDLILSKQISSFVNGYKVISAQVQVVSGVNYNLTMVFGGTTCNVTIWNRPWVQADPIKLTHSYCWAVSKRGVLMGYAHTVDVNSPRIQEMAKFAVSKINEHTGASNAMVNVISAKKQTVAGINYLMEIQLSDGKQHQICKVVVYHVEWTGKTTLSTYLCDGHNTKRAGEVHPGQLTDQVQKAVAFAEDSLNGRMNSMYRMVSEKVAHITEQLVAGMKYTFDLNLVVSSCMNTGDSMGKGLDACAPANGAKHMTCHLTVLDQAWMTPRYRMMTSNCGGLY